MVSDNIFLITLMIQNCFRERRATSEAELKDELVCTRLGKGWLAAFNPIFKGPF